MTTAETAFKPTVYIKTGCPFSFKFLIFITEAKILDQFQIIEVNPAAEGNLQIREKLEVAMGRKPSFPTVETAHDQYMSDSNELINYYAKQFQIAVEDLRVLDIYERSIFSNYLRMVRKIKQHFPDFFN